MSLFKKPSELEVTTTIKALIYGQPGLGKSTLALSTPAPVLLDFDGGVHRVSGAFQCPTLQVESWEQAQEALKEDLSAFQTIVIDTAGKMLDYMSLSIIRENPRLYQQRDGSLSLKGYGARKTKFIQFLKDVALMKKHIIFVAHEREDKDGETRIVRPEIGGSSAADLIKELDLVGYMQAIGNDRTISWSPTEKFYAKNTCNLPAIQKIPLLIDAQGNIVRENNFMRVIFQNYKDYLSKEAQTRSEYDSLIELIRSNVEDIKDADSANACCESVLALNHIWDSKLRGSLLINEKAKAIGLTFNKEKKLYEMPA